MLYILRLLLSKEYSIDTLQGVTVFPDVTYSAIVMLVTVLPYL